MTICNMSIEGGARAGLVAPDDTTFEYVHGRRHAPQGAAWDAAVARWRTLPTDDGAVFDTSITLDANTLEPMITWGTNPGMGIPITGRVPAPGGRRRPVRPPSPRARPRVHGPAARPADRRPAGRGRLHRQLHELAGSATCAWPPPRSADRHAADGVRLMVVPGASR